MNIENNKPSRKRIRLKNYDYNACGTYFITVCTKNKKCILSTGELISNENINPVGTGVLDGPKMKLTKYGQISEKYICQLNNHYSHIKVDRYVIMPNHIHMLLVVYGPSRTPVPTKCSEGDNDSKTNYTLQNSVVSSFVSTFKRFCNKGYGVNIWQRSYNDHVIRNHEEYEKISKYIYENPITWCSDNLYIEN